MSVMSWTEHCAYTMQLLQSDRMRVAVFTLLELGTCFMVDAESKTLHTTERGMIRVDEVLNPPPPTWDEMLASLAKVGFGSETWVNSHELQRMKVYVDEPCWRIEYLAGLREKYPEKVAEMVGWQGSDFPNGWIHDETCRNCKGTGLQQRDETRGYKCRTCESERPTIEDFYVDCCALEYGITKGIVDEWRAEHEEDGHHFHMPGCPLCCEAKMLAGRAT